MAFHPHYWNRGVHNGSSSFNYYEWNAMGRKDAAKHVKSDTRKQPQAEEPLELEPEIRLICPVGGIILFSAAQMHSTVPNTSGLTRFSIDFRTVHLTEVICRDGAPNVDSDPKGTSLRDFVRSKDLTSMEEDIVALYDEQDASLIGELVFRPTLSD